MPWFLYLPMRGSLAKGWTAWDGGASGTWKVSDCTEGINRIARGDCVAEKGGLGMDFFVCH